MEKETKVKLSDDRIVTVIQKRLNSGKKLRWIDDFTKTKSIGNSMNAEITSIAIMRESGIMKSIESVNDEKGKIDFTLMDLQNMDPDESDKLWDVFQELMAIDEKKNP